MKRRAEEAVKQENSVASVYGAPSRHQGGGAGTTPLPAHTTNTRIVASHTGWSLSMCFPLQTSSSNVV